MRSPSHPRREPRRRRAPDRPRARRGFTLVELLLTVAIISIATVVAWPALSTFLGGKGDASTATAVARLVNKVRDTARRRNRAHLIRFEGFAEDAPRGLMHIREGLTPSCSQLVANLDDNARLIESVPYGQTPRNEYRGHVEPRVGLTGWVAPGADQALRTDLLDLCVGPDGAVTWRPAGGALQPIAGRLRVAVQRFGGGPPWVVEGPDRGVEISFAGGAQMAVR